MYIEQINSIREISADNSDHLKGKLSTIGETKNGINRFKNVIGWIKIVSSTVCRSFDLSLLFFITLFEKYVIFATSCQIIRRNIR